MALIPFIFNFASNKLKYQPRASLISLCEHYNMFHTIKLIEMSLQYIRLRVSPAVYMHKERLQCYIYTCGVERNVHNIQE